MRKGSLIGIGIISSIIVVVVLIASFGPGSPQLSSAQDGTGGDQVADDNAKATSDGTIRQVMTFRTDLSGNDVVIDRPFFLQLKDSIIFGNDSSIMVTEVLKVAGSSSENVDVRTFEAGRIMASWSPVNTSEGVEGALLHSGSVYFEIDNETTTLVMIIISVPGTYSISVNASNAINGTSLAPPVMMNITVQDAVTPYLFAGLEINQEYMGGWSQHMDNGSKMAIAIGAKTTALWNETKTSLTRYSWTVTVINPDGMIAQDDLAPYNEGNPTLDPSNLVNTSVDSTWSLGVGSPRHVVWDHTDGVRMEGSAVTTPTDRELYYGGTQAAWMDGTWEPYGDGEMTFHQLGHYIFLFTLTKDGQAVSAPLVLETMVA